MHNRNTKSVTFAKQTYVVLIPSTEEYRVAKIHEDIWYSSIEMLGFRRSFLQELCTFTYRTSKNTFSGGFAPRTPPTLRWDQQ